MTDRTSAVLRRLRQTLQPLDGARHSDGRLLERFISRRDESAFAALVRRHGPMVLGTCQRLLHNAADAEDAFQATFLVLVRRAESVQPPDRVGPWLHGVACRTALKAKAQSVRRRARAAEAGALPRTEPSAGPDPDLRRALDRTLLGLPDIYRGPVVLCHLEGRSRREAAALLGVTEGTLSGRLARARALLARRLVGHSPALVGVALTAAVPTTLFTATVRAATDPKLAALAAAQLAGEVTQAMLWKKFHLLGVAALVLGLAAGGGAVAWGPGGAKATPTAQTAAAPSRAEPPAPRPAQAAVPAYYVIATNDNQGGTESVYRFRLEGTVAILDVVGQLQGVHVKLDGKRIWIARRTKDGSPDRIMSVDYPGLARLGDSRTNYQILPGDRVFVRPAPPEPADPPYAGITLSLPGDQHKPTSFRVRDVLIVGNERTSASVIRTELRFRPGDRVTEDQLRAAEERLVKLGLFVVNPKRHIHPTVRAIATEEGGEERDILVRVREKIIAAVDDATVDRVNGRALTIPFRLGENVKGVSRIVLFVSDDRGCTYRQVATARPDEQQFHFQAPHAGEYWFVAQAQFVYGKSEPDNPVNVRPQLKVRFVLSPEPKAAPSR